MTQEKAVTVLLSVLIVVLVAVVQEQSRHLAAIIATMPLTVASLVFVSWCWLGLRREWGFPTTLVCASAIWLLIVLIPRWVGQSPR